MSDDFTKYPIVVDMFDPKAYQFSHLAYEAKFVSAIDDECEPLKAAMVFYKDHVTSKHVYDFKENLVLVKYDNEKLISYMKEDQDFQFIGATHYDVDYMGDAHDSKDKLHENVKFWYEDTLYDPEDRNDFVAQNRLFDDLKP